MSTPEVINLILVAVTAREGFGFNRAFFLEVSGDRLRGRLGIGPASAAEAHEIWSRLAERHPDLRESLHLLSKTGEPPNPATQALALRIDIPLERQGDEHEQGILQACRQGKPAQVLFGSSLSRVEEDVFRNLSVDALAVVPLTIRHRLAGVLLADHSITRRPITQEDLDLLKTFSGYAALALERSSLHDELRTNLERLRHANRELQANQRRLLQAEKLSALGELAANVSHEIRNPLVAIGGLARSVLDDGVGSEESQEALRIIVSEVSRLERFLKETLDFAKPSVGTLESIDLSGLVRDVLSTFKEALSRSNISLSSDVPEEPVPVCVVPDALRGALTNLLRNAQEALASGGDIRVRLTHHGGVAEVEVADTGPGIPEERRRMIFEPYFTTKKDGTGIGLAITRQNIQSMGGNITVESGQGAYRTVFRIQLPAAARSGA
jgi:signal transduction histidine kinase